MLNTMFFADEIRQPGDTVERLPGQRKLPKRELDTAMQLIQQLTTSWDPERHHDTHRERVLKLIEQKASGKEPDVAETPEPDGNVIDLVAALKESIEHAREGDGRRHRDRSRRQDRRRKRPADELADLSRKELYDRVDLGVSERSKMSKEERHEAAKQAS